MQTQPNIVTVETFLLSLNICFKMHFWGVTVGVDERYLSLCEGASDKTFWETLLWLCLLKRTHTIQIAKFMRMAQHPEATGMVPAVLGLVVMDVLHSALYQPTLPPNNGISPRTPLQPLLTLREGIHNTIRPITV